MSSTGDTIAQTAQDALTADWATDALGYCSRFVRQVFEHAGIKTDGLFGASAIDTAKNFKAAGKSVPFTAVDDLQPGDVLFQEYGSEGYGHTGIYVGDGMVAENTTIRKGGKQLLPIATFGGITSVGRMAAPDPYGAYAGGTLPTPFTGASRRPYAVASGAAHVDQRSDNRGFLQQKWDGLTSALDPRSAADHVTSGIVGSTTDFFMKIWATVQPYFIDFSLLALAIVLLIIGTYAAVQGGK